MDWYYSIDGETIGPVSFEALQEIAQEGRLAPTDLVWNADMGDEWSPASHVSGLFTTPPEAYPESPAVPPTDPGGVNRVSCVEPIEIAWERMKDILFRPFSVGKWFLLGFTAWLSILFESVNGFFGNFNPWTSTKNQFDFTSSQGAGPEEISIAIKSMFEDMFTDHLAAKITVSVFIFIIGLVAYWVQCRGRFMFLDNIVHDRFLVQHPWKRFRQHGNSLFLWSVVYFIVCLAFSMILLLIFYMSIGRQLIQSGLFSGQHGLFAINVILWLVFVAINLFILRFLNDFIVPFMYDRDLKATEAWSEFLGLLGGQFLRFILYVLFYCILSMVYGLAFFALSLITCCIACCLTLIPWVGAVVLLPALVFFRLYSVEYLAQFGPAYRMRLDSEKVVEAEPVE